MDARTGHVIWLERLANRCVVHGFADQAAELRHEADEINALLPEADRVDPMDERCREHVEAKTLREFVQLVQHRHRGSGSSPEHKG